MGKDLICTLCGSDAIKINHFQLVESRSKLSNTPLIDLITNCSKYLIESHYKICQLCYDLLNDLDELHMKAKSIEDKFLLYVENVSFANISCQSSFELCKVESIDICEDQFDDCDVKSEKAETNDAENDIPNKSDISNINVKSQQKKETKGANSTNNVYKYVCHCFKKFKTIRLYNNHMKTHGTERPYVCEICGRGYKNQSSLKIHIGMHNGQNPFTCEYCNKSFTQKTALIRHLPLHTGQMPHQCDQCGKCFIHHTSFNLHRLVHSGQKPYKCSLCGLALMSGSHLKRHMKIHTGEKKFACSTCGKKFAERYNLSAHEKLHNINLQMKRKFRCQICDKLFERRGKLEEHYINVHQESTVAPSMEFYK